MLFGKVQQVGARLERPVAPRRDDLDVGVQRIGGQLEADLVVALAGRAVGDGVGAGFLRDLDQVLGDQRPGDRGAEQIEALIEGVGAEHREDEIGDEFLAHIHDADVLDAHHLGLLARRLEFVALAEIGGEGDDLGAEFGLQPFQDDRGVEPARIGEHDLLDVFPLRHAGPRFDLTGPIAVPFGRTHIRKGGADKPRRLGHASVTRRRKSCEPEIVGSKRQRDQDDRAEVDPADPDKQDAEEDAKHGEGEERDDAVACSYFSASVDRVGQPVDDLREDIDQHHAQDDDQHVGHHAAEDVATAAHAPARCP